MAVKRAPDPKHLLAAAISVERDLSIMTGAELQAKYSASDALRKVFEHVVGRPLIEVAADHNPFWHYALQTWYKPAKYRKLLHPPRHRDEVARAILMMATGQLDKYDGAHHQYPRRALKSFFAKMAADWLPKRHKIMDDLDITILYSHNIERRAHAAIESVKNMNRHNRYIQKHFGGDCRTITGKPASFIIPPSEWGEKGQLYWPCRDKEFMADERSMTAEAALSRKAGAGYNYKFIDDWESEDSRDSETIREDLADRYDQLRQLNAPPFSREWSCGTPYHIQAFKLLGMNPSPMAIAELYTALETGTFDAKRDFFLWLTNAPGKNAWPIAGATFILLAREKVDSNKKVVKFFEWSFQNGDAKAKELVYVPLPKSLKDKIRGYWKANGFI
mgnify:CR=1 FL=1